MDTSTVSSTSTSASAGTSAAASTATNSLGQDDFLKLLTAQLANQDPLQPVDNQAFIAELAQFSSLQQLQGVSSRLDSLLLATTASSQLNTASLVGKNVSYKASGADLTSGQPPPALRVNLAATAAVTAVIQDGSGHAVRTMALGVHGAGTFDLGWDGRDDSGNALPPGHYTVTLSSKAADGSSPTVSAWTNGQVQGVDFSSGSAQLVVGGASVSLSDVVEITQ
jgi:flagellar basal-body rod modification protein FlgD